MSTPAPYITDELVGKAILILKTARVQPARMDRTGSVHWHDRAQMYDAFALYNEHAAMGFLSHGCRPCHGKVFNWLMDIAFKDVRVQQLSITDDPAMAWGQDPKEGTRADRDTTPGKSDTVTASEIQA